MQKSLEEQWPPLMRARSGNTRDNKKVTCETLSKVDWYSRRPQEAKLYYHSDGDEERYGEGKPASEAEDEDEEDDKHVNEDEDGKQGRGHAGKLESDDYGKGLSVQMHHFSEYLPSKAGYDKPSAYAVISSPGRDVKKAERAPRTYPSPIPHSGNLLPHSGNLLPHSGNLLPHSGNLLPQSGRLLPHTAGPLKLHVGSHANTHTNSKPPTSRRLIPSNIGGKSSKSLVEPSSPKVTCLGRVKIKQKYCKEMGKLADMVGTTHNDKTKQSIGDQMKKLRRKKTHEVDAEAFPTELTKKGLHKAREVVNISERGKVHGDEGTRANKMGVLSSAGNTAELKKSKHGWGSRGEATSLTDAASDSETKGKKGIWGLKEARSHMKFCRDKQKWQSPDALEGQRAPSQVDCSIDLNRFCSAESEQGQEPRLPKSSVRVLNLGRSDQRLEQLGEEEFVPQAPPPNSLLLMRNSKNRGTACATITSSSSSRIQAVGLSAQRHTAQEEPKIVSGVDRQGHLASSKEGNFQHMSSSSLGEKMEEGEATTMADGHQQAGSFLNMKVKEPMACSITSQECKLLQVKMNAMASGQATLRNAPCEKSLWQRRSIMTLSALDVGKPITTR